MGEAGESRFRASDLVDVCDRSGGFGLVAALVEVGDERSNLIGVHKFARNLLNAGLSLCISNVN